MSRFCLTGGAGFIGVALARRLIATGHEVVVLDDLSTGRAEALPGGVPLIRASVLDPEALAQALQGVTACFHLAAIASVVQSITAWGASTQVNLAGSVAVFEACAARDIPVVYASSAAVYGVPQSLPIRESDPALPISPYGVDKLGMEHHAAAGGRTRGLRSVGLRLFNIYGPGQDPRSPYSGVISIFITKALDGAPLTILGDGEQTRDFVFVEDLVDALVLAPAAASPQAPVANVATGQPISIAGLANAIVTACKSTSVIQSGPARAGDIQHSVGDASLLRRLVPGWAPRTGLSAGLAATVAALRESAGDGR